MELEERILEFINRRFPTNCSWLTGNCYFMALILNDVFDLPIYYLPVDGHFAVYNKDSGNFFDWTGVVNLVENESPILFTLLEQNDPTWYSRIVNNCKG